MVARHKEGTKITQALYVMKFNKGMNSPSVGQRLVIKDIIKT
jgi:hypothetical protein